MADESESGFQFLAENSIDIICRSRMDRVLNYVSPSCFSTLGWKPEEMTGRAVEDFILDEDHPVLAAAIATHAEGAMLRMMKKDGSTVWMDNRARLVRDPVTGEPKEWVVTMRDISERKALEDRLSRLALSDGLTGLPNRRAFDEALEREWKRTLRESSQISLLLLDVDYFKEFNDQYGHQVGDDCLRAVAAAVKGTLRASDTAARYGGEEIAVILPATDNAGAVGVAEAMRSAIEALRLPQGEASGRSVLRHREYWRRHCSRPGGRDHEDAGKPASGGGHCHVQSEDWRAESCGNGFARCRYKRLEGRPFPPPVYCTSATAFENRPALQPGGIVLDACGACDRQCARNDRHIGGDAGRAC